MKRMNKIFKIINSALLVMILGFCFVSEKDITYTEQKNYFTGSSIQIIEKDNSTNSETTETNNNTSNNYHIIYSDEEIERPNRATISQNEVEVSTQDIIRRDKEITTQNSTKNDAKTTTQNSTKTDTKTTTKTTTSTKNSSTSTAKKNGWYTQNGKKYYYKNGKKLTNTYVDYIYLNSNGVAQEKIGNFSATLYGAKAWANQKLNIRNKASYSGKIIGNIPTGGKMTILSEENASTKYIKVKYNNIVGYVYSDYIYINLPDVIPDAVYKITNASQSIYKSSGKKIPGITGENLYGYTKKYNAKIGKSTYYAPLLYPVAKQLQKAYNNARKEGYNLKIYDTYRPYDVSVKVNNSFKNLYNSNKTVKNAVNYDKSGKYWGPSWFLANSISRHNRGTALDLTLTDSNNKELAAQTPMHTLDTRSLRKYNNKVAKKLSSIMTSAGFETLDSEWWHFQEDNYKSSAYNSFKIK